MGVLNKAVESQFEKLKQVLSLKNNEVLSIEAGGSQLDLILKQTPGYLKFEILNIRPGLKDYGNTHHETKEILQNHTAIISKVDSLRFEMEKQLEGVENAFELKKILNSSLKEVKEKLINKKALLNIKFQADVNESETVPSLSTLHPSLLSSPHGAYEGPPKIVNSLKNKNQKFGLPCVLEVHVASEIETEAHWFLNQTLLIQLPPNVNSGAHKNVKATKNTSNNMHIYKLIIDNFSHQNTGTYTFLARNMAGESSSKCHVDHISNHSTPCTAQSPTTYRSVSREGMHFDLSSLASISEDSFQNAPKFQETLSPLEAWERDPVLFKVHLTGHPEPEVRWFREGVEIFNSPDFRISRDPTFRNIHYLEIPEIFFEDAGRFTCIANNYLGSCQSTATLTVRASSVLASNPTLISDQSLEDFGLSFTPSNPSVASSLINFPNNMIRRQFTPNNVAEECVRPYFKATSKDLEICNGKVARFDSIVGGKPTPDVAWIKDDNRLMTDDKYAVVVNEKGVNSLIIKCCGPQDSGVYRCIASNKAGQDYFEVRLNVTVGISQGRYSPSSGMTKIARNFHSEERNEYSYKVRNGLRKYDIHSEERNVTRRNFYKTDEIVTNHKSLRDSGRKSPKKSTINQAAMTNSTDETSVGPPVLLTPIDDPEAGEGDSVELSCRVFSPGKCFYQWFFNNEPLSTDPKKYEIITTSDRYTLRIFNLSVEDRGFYQCTVVNDDGEVTCIGRVNPLGGLISRPGSEVRICKSPTPFNEPYWTRTIKEIKLSCTVIGNPMPKLTWYIGDEIILSNCEDFESKYDQETCLVELRIKNVEKYLNRKIKCVAENHHGIAETECILTESILTDPTLTHPDYSNLLIHQISSQQNLPISNTTPRFSHRIKPKMVNEGDVVTLTAVVHGRPQPIVRWVKDGETEITPSKKHTLISNEKTNICQLRIFNCQPQDSGNYSCIAYNPNGQTTCSTAVYISPPGKNGNLLFENIPQITQNLEPSYTIVPGQPVKFTCRIKKEPSIHVTWYYNGIEVSSGHMMDVVDGDVVSSLSIPHPKTANQGEYSCYVRNLYGETKTSTYLEIEESTIATVNYRTHAKLQENELKFSMPVIETHSIAQPPNENINRYYNAPPAFNQPLVNHIASEGSESFFVVKFTGEPPPSIQWFVNGNLISEKNSSYKITTDFTRKESILYIKEVFVKDNGEYTCRAENISGIAHTTSHLYIKTSDKYTSKENYIYGSSQSLNNLDDEKPKFNVELTLVRPEKNKKFLSQNFEIYDDNETKKIEIEKEYYMQPEPGFSETISIDKTDQQIVHVEVPKSRKMSEIYIHRPSLTGTVSEMEIEMMKGIDLVPEKKLKRKLPKEFVTSQDSEVRKLTVESEFVLQPEPTFSETVSIDKSEVQEVVFESLPTKQTSEISVSQEASLKGIKMEAEIILVKEPQNFTETVSIDKSRDQEIEFSLQKPNQTSELTVHQKSMPKGTKIEAEILSERKLTSEIVLETGSAPKFLIELVPVNVMDGSPVYFTTKVFACPMPEYVTWYRNEKNCEEIVHIHVDYNIETGISNLHISEVFPEDSGLYTCVASNPFGIAKSSATLTVSAYEQCDNVEYAELSSFESDVDDVFVEGELVRNEFIKNEKIFAQKSHTKPLLTDDFASEIAQPLLQTNEKKYLDYNFERGCVLEKNQTKICPFRAVQLNQEPLKSETVNDINRKTLDLITNTLRGEVTKEKLIFIDKKQKVPTLSKLASTNLDVEKTEFFYDQIEKNYLSCMVEPQKTLEKHTSGKVTFRSQKVKNDGIKYEAVDEKLDSSGDESLGNVSEFSGDFPNFLYVTNQMFKVKKDDNLSTHVKPSFTHLKCDEFVDNIELKCRHNLNLNFEPKPFYEKSSKNVLPSMTKQINKSPECFETIDSSGYDSTELPSELSNGSFVESHYVKKDFELVSTGQKVPVLAKVIIDNKTAIETVHEHNKTFHEEKALNKVESGVAFEKGLSQKTHFRTKQKHAGKSAYETVSNKTSSPTQETICNISELFYNPTQVEVVTKETSKVQKKSPIASRINLKYLPCSVDTLSFNKEFKTEKSMTMFEPESSLCTHKLVLIPSLSKQKNKEQTKFETVTQTCSEVEEITGTMVNAIDSLAKTSQITSNVLFKADKSFPTMTLALLVKTKIMEYENVFPFAKLLNEDRVSLSHQETKMIENIETNITKFMTKPLIQTPLAFERIEQNLTGSYSDKISKGNILFETGQFLNSSKTSAVFHSSRVNVESLHVDRAEDFCDNNTVYNINEKFETSDLKNIHSKSRQNIYAAYQYLDSESDVQSDSVSSDIKIKPSERASEKYIATATVMSEPVKMNEYHITPLLERFAEEKLYGIDIDMKFDHMYPDLISSNFNRSVDNLKLVNHSSSIVDVQKSEIVRMIEQPLIKSILSIPEKISVRLMRLESIDTTLYRTSLLDYLMLLDQAFSLKTINLDNQTSVIPYADIVRVETERALSEEQSTTRLMTNVYFLQLEEVKHEDFSFNAHQNQEKIDIREELQFSQKQNLLNQCISQFKTIQTEDVVLKALEKISAMLCIPENIVCSIERAKRLDAVLYRTSLPEYVLCLEKILSLQSLNLDALAVILPQNDIVEIQTCLANLNHKPFLRTQASVFLMKLDDVKEENISTVVHNLQPIKISENLCLNDKQLRQLSFSLPIISTNYEEMAFEAISANLAATYNSPLLEKQILSRSSKDEKVLTKASVNEYIMFLERIMALNSFNIDDSAMNLTTPSMVRLETGLAFKSDKPLTRIQPELFYLEFDQSKSLNTSVENVKAGISEQDSEMTDEQKRTLSLSHVVRAVEYYLDEQVYTKMVSDALVNLSKAFCVPENVVCEINKAQASTAVLYRTSLSAYILMLERVLPVQAINLDALAVMLPQADLILLQTSLAMINQRPLTRCQPHLYFLKVDNVIEKDMSFKSFNVKSQNIIKEIAKTDKNKVLSRVSVSEYKLLLEQIMALNQTNTDNMAMDLPLPDLVFLQTLYAFAENKPLSRVQPNFILFNFEETQKYDNKVEKSSAKSSQTDVGFEAQSSITKVKEYYLEPEEVVEKEEKPVVKEPMRQRPDDEDEEEQFEDVYETWETNQKTETLIESDNESESSVESIFEEWEFTLIKKRLVEEEIPMEKKKISKKTVTTNENSCFMEGQERYMNASYAERRNFKSDTSFDSRVYSTNVFNQVTQKSVDETYKRPSFKSEITTSELRKNNPVTITTVVSAMPEPEIEWYKDGQKIINSRSFSTYYGDGSCKLIIHKFTPRYSGTYACRAINEVGMNETFIELDYDFFEPDGQEVDKTYDHMTYEESFLEVREEWKNIITEEISYKSLEIPTAPTFDQEISSITVVDGSDVTLYCRLISYPEAKIEWYFRDKLIKKSRDHYMGYKNDYCYLFIKEAMSHDQGEYKIKASNAHGFSETVIYLTVLDSYELRETSEMTFSTNRARSFKAASRRNYRELIGNKEESELMTKNFRSKQNESIVSKKFSKVVDTEEEFYSSGEESVDMWTVEEWLFYDFKKYYNSNVLMKKRDDYLDYYKYVAYDERSFRERISSAKAALCDKHAFRFPVIIKELPILEVFENKKVVMECIVEARPVPQIIWFKNGKQIESNEHVKLTFENNIARLVIERALLDDEAEYRCVAKNEFGSSFTWGQLYVETVQLRWGRIKNFKIVRKKCLL